MSAACCAPKPANSDPRWRRALWIALGVNATMFVVETVAGLASGSVALRADALDFLGDAANYAISLAVVGMALAWRARAALLKGAMLIAFGSWVLWTALAGIPDPAPPGASMMGAVGLAALAANLGVAAMLYRFRSGEANMRSVWICSRNDAVGNVAVLLAALGVFGTGAAWPDLIVAGVIASLSLWGGAQVVREAARELSHASAPQGRSA